MAVNASNILHTNVLMTLTIAVPRIARSLLIQSCEDVVREGSMRFDVLEPPRTSAYCTLHTLYPLKRSNLL